MVKTLHILEISLNGDGTITDNVTGLMWEQDMGVKISYSDAFSKAANSITSIKESGSGHNINVFPNLATKNLKVESSPEIK